MVPPTTPKFFSPEFCDLCQSVTPAERLIEPGMPSSVSAAYDRKQKDRAKLEAQCATVKDVVRKEDRMRKGIAYAKGLPLNVEGNFLDGNSTTQKHSQLNWDTDQNRSMVCNMLGIWNRVVDYWFGGNTPETADAHAKPHEEQVFASLVQEEEGKAAKPLIKGDHAPYRARAARGLILLLASTLG